MFYKTKIIASVFLKSLAYLVFCGLFFLKFAPIFANTSDYQRCELNEDCILGEYVFDNDGNFINQQACVISIKNPSGTSLVNEASMNFETDGWHNYTYISSGPEGLYRSLMCCELGTDSACIDKSFVVGTSLESLKQDSQLTRKSTFDFSGTADAGSTTSSLVDSELSQGEDYWENYTLVMLTGNNAGEERVVESFNSISDSLSFLAFSQAINEGDEYILRRDNRIFFGIWNYTNRTLSSISNVVSEIWSYSNRTLSSFGSLASDVWSDTFSPNRTITSKILAGGGSLSTESYSQQLQSELSTEIGLVESSLSSTDVKVDSILLNTVDIESKIDNLQTDLNSLNSKVDLIYNDTQTIKVNVDSLLIKWGSSSAEELLTEIGVIKNLLGTGTDDSTTNSIFGRTNYLVEKWGIQSAQALQDSSSEILNKTNNIQDELGYNEKTETAYSDLQIVKNYVDNLEELIGNSEDSAVALTVFGKIKNINEKIDTLNEADVDVLALLDKWGEYSADELITRLDNIKDKVEEVNSSEIDDKLESLKNKVNEDLEDSKALQNEIIETKAMIDINRSLIENKPVVKTFYEWGSVVLKIVIANPSERKQTINFRSALPKEIRPKDIIKKDEELDLEFDAEKDRWFVSAEAELSGNQSITKFVEVDDIWTISKEEIESLRRQSVELSKPLENTSYYGQGVIIVNDINSRLDKITMIQNQESITPEDHILNYRINLGEIETIKGNIDSLRVLVGDVSNSDNFKGSLVGVSTTMTWAIILVVIAGVGVLLVFLAIALKEKKEIAFNTGDSVDFFNKSNSEFSDNDSSLEENRKIKREGISRGFIWKVFVVFFIGSLFFVIFILYKNQKSTSNKEEKIIVENDYQGQENLDVASEENEEEKAIESNQETESEIKENKEEQSLQRVRILETGTGWLNVREKPGIEFQILDKITISSEWDCLEKHDDWVMINLGDDKTGWVNNQYVKIIENDE